MLALNGIFIKRFRKISAADFQQAEIQPAAMINSLLPNRSFSSSVFFFFNL